MGYRDDVYAVWNIIGYTGQLHDFPTVYFVATDLGFGGHITQKHGSPNNVGRQEVFPLAGYTYGNEDYAGKRRLVERWPGGGFHASRNLLIEVDQAKPDMRTVSVLAQAIKDYPNEKYVSHSTRAQFDAFLEAADAKDAMIAQMNMLNARGDAARGRRGH
jgi:hypothetical protein